jgi:hypothetical protein
MPKAVLEVARQGIDPDRLAVESLISDLHRRREEAESAGEAQRIASTETERARSRVTKEFSPGEPESLIEQTRGDN